MYVIGFTMRIPLVDFVKVSFHMDKQTNIFYCAVRVSPKFRMGIALNALNLSKSFTIVCVTHKKLESKHMPYSKQQSTAAAGLLQNGHHERRRQRPRLLLPCLTEGLDLRTAALLRGDRECHVVRVEDGVLHGHATHTNNVD